MDTKFKELKVIIDGIPRLVIYPKEELDIPAEEAIKIDAYDTIYPLFEHASPEFWKVFTQALWSKGLIRQSDFRKPSAHKKIKQALNLAIRNDVLSIMSLLQE